MISQRNEYYDPPSLTEPLSAPQKGGLYEISFKKSINPPPLTRIKSKKEMFTMTKRKSIPDHENLNQKPRKPGKIRAFCCYSVMTASKYSFACADIFLKLLYRSVILHVSDLFSDGFREELFEVFGILCAAPPEFR